MKKLTGKKLELSKETLTNLQDKVLEAVAGGNHRQTLSGCD